MARETDRLKQRLFGIRDRVDYLVRGSRFLLFSKPSSFACVLSKRAGP
jgi:hypothetical protein